MQQRDKQRASELLWGNVDSFENVKGEDPFLQSANAIIAVLLATLRMRWVCVCVWWMNNADKLWGDKCVMSGRCWHSIRWILCVMSGQCWHSVRWKLCDEWTMLTLYKMKTVCGEWAMLAHYGVISWGTGIAQWLEHQTCDRMVAGSSLSRAAWEVSYPGSIFCAESYFGIHSTTVFLQQHLKDPYHSAISVGGRLQLNTLAPTCVA